MVLLSSSMDKYPSGLTPISKNTVTTLQIIRPGNNMRATQPTDLESGNSNSNQAVQRDNSFKTILSSFVNWPAGQQQNSYCPQIEDHPEGYPQFTALVAAHPSFHICRRFLSLRARLLLSKQDKLVLLEQELEDIDRNEASPLFLGCQRRDTNQSRHSVLESIDTAMADYDSFLTRYQQILRFESPPQKTVSNLRNWVESTGCLSRRETEFLLQRDDLLSIGMVQDDIVLALQYAVEHARVLLERPIFKNTDIRTHGRVSRNPIVHIFRPSFVTKTAGLLGIMLAAVLLLTPVIVCNFVHDLTSRLAVVVFATSGFIASISTFMKARPVEIVVAGATYSTVLVVFISSAGTA
ncbi:hypothetical protein B0T11DRAFT_289885 [Plectosphaerella cucumerina]|uniref:DUF6594 domain-containing protein n=1 Tax=Plectosphaerella cucumerina TaxID=40658 RepID=A0A8K0TC46_9PEZI|nr:hypothetical protein B0T11DRAFT_289885 [Plectosphaerella cucumerina]